MLYFLSRSHLRACVSAGCNTLRAITAKNALSTCFLGRRSQGHAVSQGPRFDCRSEETRENRKPSCKKRSRMTFQAGRRKEKRHQAGRWPKQPAKSQHLPGVLNLYGLPGSPGSNGRTGCHALTPIRGWGPPTASCSSGGQARPGQRERRGRRTGPVAP